MRISAQAGAPHRWSHPGGSACPCHITRISCSTDMWCWEAGGWVSVWLVCALEAGCRLAPCPPSRGWVSVWFACALEAHM
jgi:hypothetical protein